MSKDRIRMSDPVRLMVAKALLLYAEKESLTEAWEAYNFTRSLVLRPKGARQRGMTWRDDKQRILEEMKGYIEQLKNPGLTVR